MLDKPDQVLVNFTEFLISLNKLCFKTVSKH